MFIHEALSAFTSSRRMIWPVISRADIRAEYDAQRLVQASECPAPTRPEVSTMVAVEL